MGLNSRTGFASFKPLLGICCDIIRPDIVVEWGPGESTAFLLEKTVAHIHTWENVHTFYMQAKNRFANNPRVSLYLSLAGRGNGKNTAYVNAPMVHFKLGSVKLLFVDGRARADCMICASQLVAPNGVVVLHDDLRSTYDEGRGFYPYCFRPKRTITGVYSKNESLINQIKDRFDIDKVPIDYGGKANIPV